MKTEKFDTFTSSMRKISYKGITTTLRGKSQTAKLAGAIVRSRLAACVQFWPIQSTYWWKSRVQTGSEFILVCKTRALRVTALQRFIKSHHPYKVPEIVVTPIETGFPPYLAWISKETSEPPLTFTASPTRKRSSRSDGKS